MTLFHFFPPEGHPRRHVNYGTNIRNFQREGQISRHMLDDADSVVVACGESCNTIHQLMNECMRPIRLRPHVIHKQMDSAHWR